MGILAQAGVETHIAPSAIGPPAPAVVHQPRLPSVLTVVTALVRSSWHIKYPILKHSGGGRRNIKSKDLKMRDSRTRISPGKRCKVEHVDQGGMGRDKDDKLCQGRD